jgi:hypothetical protein
MSEQIPHYEAETCHTGGYLCGHRHRTREAAERCLPKLPKQSSGSLTRYFSMARVLPMNEAARELDAAREAALYGDDEADDEEGTYEVRRVSENFHGVVHPDRTRVILVCTEEGAWEIVTALYHGDERDDEYPWWQWDELTRTYGRQIDD